MASQALHGHHHPDARSADAEPALDTLDRIGIGTDDAEETWISIGLVAARIRRGAEARRVAAIGEEVDRNGQG